MNSYDYELSIPAQTEEEADKKVEALTDLASRLPADDLAALAHVVTTDPDTIALAKDYLGI